ncbi:lysophospholipase [bacterium]|nr:lysophospholipase [bacterium]
MSTFLNIIKILVVVYLILLTLLYLFQDRLIFFAQPISNPFVSRFSDDEIRFDHDGIFLHGWLIRKGSHAQSPLIIYYGGNAEEVSGNLLDLERFPPASLLLMNYRGYGKSTGKPSEDNLVSDAIFVFDEIVRKEGIDPRQVLLMGRSLGSGVAVQVAAQRTVGGLILVTPFDSLVEVARSHYPIFPVGLAIRHRFESAQLAPKIKAPALILMGSADRIVPNRHSKALAKSWGGSVNVITIQNADHNSIHLVTDYWSAISDFVKENASFPGAEFITKQISPTAPLALDLSGKEKHK